MALSSGWKKPPVSKSTFRDMQRIVLRTRSRLIGGQGLRWVSVSEFVSEVVAGFEVELGSMRAFFHVSSI